MSNSLYTVRNYQLTDFDNYVRLIVEAGKLKSTECCTSSEVVREKLHRPNHSPEQDLFIAETAGSVVGYMDVFPELIIKQVVIKCLIHPAHRRRGLATKLHGYAMNRARELGVKLVQVNIAQDNIIAKNLLSKLGFRFARIFLEVRVNISRACWQDTNRTALQFCHLHRGEEDKLAQIQNRSFAGLWGYNPNTTEEIIYYLGLANCYPEDVILAYDGDRIVGYCWTRIHSVETTTDERKGQIHMLGVDPEYRGKGIGKQVLLAGLFHLKSKGLQVVELTVDSRNQAARSLYRSVGFKVLASNLWYEKTIN